MTPLGLIAMRRTAALVHAAPGLRARLRHGDHAVLEVRRPSPTDVPAARWLTPCAFRLAVGHAVEAVRAGRTIAVLGLPPGCDPAIDVCATEGSALLPGGIVEIAATGSIELAFVTTLTTAQVEQLCTECDDEVRVHADAVTDTTLVVHRARPHPSTDSLTRALDKTQELLARCSVTELLAHVTAPPDHPPPADSPTDSTRRPPHRPTRL